MASYRHIQKAANDLAAALCCKDDSTALRLLDVYGGSVLGYTGGRVPVARGFFLPTASLLLARLDQRSLMPTVARQQLIDEFVLAIEDAETADQLMNALRAMFERLLLARRAVDGPKILRLWTALSYIDENFTRPLALGEIARRSGFSVAAFTSIFRCRTGTTFLRYVRGLRVEHAKRLLRATHMSPKEIAAASGFASASNMGHSFHVTVGCAPRDFRRAVPDQAAPDQAAPASFLPTRLRDRAVALTAA